MKRKLKTRIHFNRINMQRGNPKVWTAHNSRACFQGEKIRIVHNGVVVAETVYRPEANQPRAYVSVQGNVKVLEDGTLVVEV